MPVTRATGTIRRTAESGGGFGGGALVHQPGAVRRANDLIALVDPVVPELHDSQDGDIEHLAASTARAKSPHQSRPRAITQRRRQTRWIDNQGIEFQFLLNTVSSIESAIPAERGHGCSTSL
ncbi:hypothetical protein OU415_25595 [Saccharopolyspora sp. WRP15-2]|uniref:Uncharacterized protein n=1 Tax=Saccharopolyspora oryzae TaxID=2997343 RepID=A0ABT4V6A6_9PSEU|nr:hypothetical protein [Saccharopolyspora oryzae]MDA3628832.1 hypothetical protein [Saccharopolyspora oryzae]